MPANRRSRLKKTEIAPPILRKASSEEISVDYEFEDNEYEVKILQDDTSITFLIFRYPFLVICVIALLIDLIIYSLLRFSVSIWESVFSSLQFKLKRHKQKLKNSQTYDEWAANAIELDNMLGIDEWKTAPTNAFDERLVKRVTRTLKRDRKLNLVTPLMDTLMTAGIKNNLGNIENERLYSRCYLGTKTTIIEYVDEVLKSLNFVGKSKDIDIATKFTFFKHASRLYGRSALCLSGGASFAWFHMGVCKALFEKELLPKVFTGASAGSMVAAMICVRTNDELPELFETSLWRKITCMESTITERLQNFWRTGALFRNEEFLEKAIPFTKGDMTFREAFDLTGRILNITVMSDEHHSKLKVLNYINTPTVTIRSAVVASSSIPGVIQASQLYYKNAEGRILPYMAAGRLWRDGSMVSDIPNIEIQQQFRVKHTVVSQVNPHISMFFFRSQGTAGAPSINRNGRGWRGGFLFSTLIQLFMSDLKKWLTIIKEMKLLPNIMGGDFSNLYTQVFDGDITILPPVPSLWQFRYLLADPTLEQYSEYLRNGQLYTWPKIGMIENQMRIEQTIGDWYNHLRVSYKNKIN